MTRRNCAALGLLLLVAVTGCGPKLAEVKGTVTYKGKPLEVRGCEIAFMSENGRVNIAAPLNDDGTYRVSMADGYGLPPGKYKIAVVFPMGYNPRTPTMTDAEADRLLDKAIPRKYRSKATSGFVLDLSPEGAEFNVDMVDDAKK